MKTAPTTYDIKKITTRGAIVDSSLSLIDGQLSIKMYPKKVDREAIVIFPSNINIPPRPDITMNLEACFKIRINASIAD